MILAWGRSLDIVAFAVMGVEGDNRGEVIEGYIED